MGAKRRCPNHFAANNEAIPPETLRMFAKPMDADTVEVPSSHVAMVSHPAEVQRLIQTAAQSSGA